jgi:hypothetical protein
MLTLISDSWSGDRNAPSEVFGPTEQQVVDAVRALDGAIHTLVTLQGHQQRHLALGGGPDSYVVYATFDNEAFHSAMTPGLGGTIHLVAGGQAGEYLARRTVNRNVAIKAALTFLHDQALDPTIVWEDD